MKDNIIYGHRPWTTEGSPAFLYDVTRLDKYDEKYERFIVESFDGATLGIINSKLIGVAYYSKLGREIGSKEYALLGISEGALEGIPKDIILGSNEGCVECKSLGINDWESEVIKDQPLLR